MAGLRWPQRLWALLLIPLIRLAGDVAKMLGYPAGLRWRRKNRARDGSTGGAGWTADDATARLE